MPSPEMIDPSGQNGTGQERIDTLVCQITDGFLRGNEERTGKDVRPFEELLANLLPRAGLFARNVVAQKLSPRRDVPRRILDLLLADDAAVVEPLIAHSPRLTADDLTQLINRRDPILRQSLFKREDLTLMQRQSLLLDMPVRKIASPATFSPATLQIAAKAAALPITAPQQLAIDIPQAAPSIQPAAGIIVKTPQQEVVVRPSILPQNSTKLLQQIVRAAVLRRHEELAALVARETDLSPVIAEALLKDASGEALMATCHHIGVPEDASVQIATLLYPALARSRAQLTSLRKLYRHFTPQATTRIIAAWRALPQNRPATHETVHVSQSVAAAPPHAESTSLPAAEKISA